MKEMIKKKYIPILLFLFVVGCAAQQTAKEFSELTPKQRATWLMENYNVEYAAYLIAVEKPVISEELNLLLQRKKTVMRSIFPMLRAYSASIKTGVVDEELQRRVYDTILHLISLGGYDGK